MYVTLVSSAYIQLAFCGCSSEQSCLNRRCTCVRLSLPCSRAYKCCDTNRCRNPENRWCWEWMKLYNVWHTEVTDMKSWSEIVSICLYIINIVLWRESSQIWLDQLAAEKWFQHCMNSQINLFETEYLYCLVIVISFWGKSVTLFVHL